MQQLEDYEVLNILSTTPNSTYYKVQNKLDGKIFLWKAINYETFSGDKEVILERVNKLKNKEQPNLLRVFNEIILEDSRTVYLIAEYCKYGSLHNIIQRCRKHNEYVDEDFIWCLLYKLACHLKIYEATSINLHDVFLDDLFIVKILQFSLDDNKSTMKDIVEIIYKLIQSQFVNERSVPSHYTKELRNVLEFLSENDDNNIDAILCHPTALLKLSLPTKRSIFHKNLKPSSKIAIQENNSNDNLEALYQAKLENLRNREAVLKVNEQKISDKMFILEKREKKVALLERMIKEKIARADLYLKRAKEQKSTSKVTLPKLESTPNMDTSFSADCGDTSILPTSCKLNIQVIQKPQKFTRTLSERRVRFKQHSPLKEIHNIRREIIKQRAHPEKRLSKIESDSDKTSDANSEKCVREKIKKKNILSTMFMKKPKKPNSIVSSSDSVSVHTYEDLDKQSDENTENLQDCKPINWTEESKKQAFDLLRILNEEQHVDQLKHTFL